MHAQKSERNWGIKNYSYNQIGSIITLLTLAVWGVIVLLFHTRRLAGMIQIELTLMGTLSSILWILVPLYWKRVRWSYIVYIGLVIFGFGGTMLIAMGIAIAPWRTLQFSLSLYNIITLIIYIISILGVYFSYRAFRELKKKVKKKDLAGIGGIVILTVIIGAGLSANADSFYWNNMYTNVMQPIDQNLENLDTLDEKLQYLVEIGKYPSVVAGIVVNDELIWANTYGDANLDTVYRIGSVTKPFTATAILQLYERNLLDLDADVNTYLPFSLRHPQYPEIPITARMLLQHHSGLGFTGNHQVSYDLYPYFQLRDWEAEVLGLEHPKMDPFPTFGEFLQDYLTPGGAYYSPTVWTNLKPGTAYTYANVGFDLLGFIVEQITRQPFPEYLQEHIWDPLNMTRTGVHVAELAPNVAVGHERFFGVLSKSIVEVPLWDKMCIGAGGILSTVPDLAQFLIAHMNQGQVNGYQLLKPETIELMHNKLPTSGVGDFGQVGTGLAWTHRNPFPVLDFDLRGSQGHGGSNPGYLCQMWMVEQDHGAYGIILMTNIAAIYKTDWIWNVAPQYSMQEVLLDEAEALSSQISTT